ncbi:DUF1643 domain-containing protein [Sphingobium sp. JS3065]|uniref:DUF1643 domain-containing protein n=1 Tax=Sphingobium sp. JS3065 TaxID=2970925 RepID=UPI00226553A7|nr:DUF1643 domain-containing protein [Sphingobium sp. JS3065]UZW55540.1 DUF1643 domain-containing protein [Sphingobium sp. JS3065]
MSFGDDLFGFQAMRSAAVISPCGTWRYELRRIWDDRCPLLVVCMLNPSTADHRINDPTILALIHFAKLWGFGGLLVVNLFAFRSSCPAEMMARADAFGPENGRYILSAMQYAAAHGGQLLVAWGNGGDHDDRAEWFCARALRQYQLTLICLGTTNRWKPKHPMARGAHRIPRDQQPIIYRRPVGIDE